MKEKAALRRRMYAMRSSLTNQEHDEKSQEICRRLVQFVSSMNRPLTIAAFMPYRGEVDIVPFIEFCWRDGIRIAIPRPEPQSKQLAFFMIHSMDDVASEMGAYGIREPREEEKHRVYPDQFGIALVPGLAFDRKLARLGYGGGYYDRWLTRFVHGEASRPLFISPAFELQIVDEVPIEEHDVLLDAVVTEKQMIRRQV